MSKQKKSTEEQIQNLVNQFVGKEETVNIIQAILNNICNFFDNEKVRKLNLKNKKIEENLLSSPQAIELLVLMKFNKTDTHLELKKDAITLKEMIYFKQCFEKAIVKLILLKNLEESID